MSEHCESSLLELHEINETFLDHHYFEEFDILTFDDGLYSQFKYFDFFKSLNKPLIYFISTAFISPEGIIQNENIDCRSGHRELGLENGVIKTFNSSALKYYMNPSQIKYLSEQPNVEIGGHGHFHTKPKTFKEVENEFKPQILEKIINKKITSYALPYNQKSKIYEIFLKSRGLKIYGSERIPFHKYVKSEGF